MSDLGEEFDANAEEPTSFDVLPAGEYEAMIVESERRQAATGNGDYIAMTFQILGPEYAGRKLWLNLNLWNTNPQAVQIARGQLSAICRAVKVMRLRETTELHNLPMLITVAIKKRKDTGDPENRITNWKPKDGAGAVASRAEPKPTPTPGKGAAPWSKKQTG